MTVPQDEQGPLEGSNCIMSKKATLLLWGNTSPWAYAPWDSFHTEWLLQDCSSQFKTGGFTGLFFLKINLNQTKKNIVFKLFHALIMPVTARSIARLPGMVSVLYTNIMKGMVTMGELHCPMLPRTLLNLSFLKWTMGVKCCHLGWQLTLPLSN